MGIDILDSIVNKIADKTYPNIKFYLHKDEINWKAQMDNMKEVMDICVDMWKETDWDAFWGRQKFKVQDFKNRIAREAKTIKEMSLDWTRSWIFWSTARDISATCIVTAT